MKEYRYPDELFCGKCEEFKKPLLRVALERLIVDGQEQEAEYTEAVCPECGSMLCDRDRFMIPLRMAKKIHEIQ